MLPDNGAKEWPSDLDLKIEWAAVALVGVAFNDLHRELEAACLKLLGA